jgi:hypothetical protein
MPGEQNDIPLKYATITWTPGTGEIEAVYSRIGDWRLLEKFGKIGGNVGVAWRKLKPAQMRRAFFDLVDLIKYRDQVEHEAVDHALSVIAEYRVQLAKDQLKLQKKADKKAERETKKIEQEYFDLLRSEYGDATAPEFPPLEPMPDAKPLPVRIRRRGATPRVAVHVRHEQEQMEQAA